MLSRKHKHKLMLLLQVSRLRRAWMLRPMPLLPQASRPPLRFKTPMPKLLTRPPLRRPQPRLSMYRLYPTLMLTRMLMLLPIQAPFQIFMLSPCTLLPEKKMATINPKTSLLKSEPPRTEQPEGGHNIS